MQFRADLITKSGVAPTSGDMGGVGEQAFFTNGRLAAFNAANSALMTIETMAVNLNRFLTTASLRRRREFPERSPVRHI